MLRCTHAKNDPDHHTGHTHMHTWARTPAPLIMHSHTPNTEYNTHTDPHTDKGYPSSFRRAVTTAHSRQQRTRRMMWLTVGSLHHNTAPTPSHTVNPVPCPELATSRMNTGVPCTVNSPAVLAMHTVERVGGRQGEWLWGLVDADTSQTDTLKLPRPSRRPMHSTL